MADDVIVLTGIKETLDALKEFDKDAVKRFNKVINTELAGAQRDAKNLISEEPPMSGWRKADAAKPTKTRGGKGWPGWNAGEIQSKITKTRAEGKVRKGDFCSISLQRVQSLKLLVEKHQELSECLQQIAVDNS